MTARPPPPSNDATCRRCAQPACGATSFSSDESNAGDDAGSGGSGATSGKGGTGGSASGKGGGGTAGTGRGGSAGEAGRGGSAGEGANGGQAGSTAGSAATAGLGGCGFCPVVACFAPEIINVSPESSTAGIQDLTVESDDLSMSCYGGGLAPCQWTCDSQQFGLPDGHYSIRLSAPGYETQTVEFDVVNPTNCGCCGCGCGPNVQKDVTLKPNGDPVGNCCAVTATDPDHCGECNNACDTRLCSEGECEGTGGTGGIAGTGGTSGIAGTGGAHCNPPVPPESDPDCPSDLSMLQAQPCDQFGMECYQLQPLGSDPCGDGYSSSNALCCDGTWQLSSTIYPPGTSWLDPICAIAAD